MSLDGRTAMVTGGSRGIGRAIATALAQAGANVALTYQSRTDEAEKTVKAITDTDANAISLKMDVRDRAAVQAALQETVRKFGGLDILINNAGINNPTDFDKITDTEWDEILDVNLKGPFVCTQEALPYLRNSEHASIVNIGSVSGQYGGPRTAHYAASKAGLISLGQVIARFAAKDNIRCNTLAAGMIESEMAAAGMQSAAVNDAAKGILLGRMGTPEEVANAAVFLASDAAGYITGQTLNVNGGLYF